MFEKKLNMKDDKHEFLNTMAMRDFLHHITASTRFTRSNEKRKVEEQSFSPVEQHSYHGHAPLVPPP